ncbi:uncharacterized protein MKZ38_007621 [Zalerion maritima]|uniref:3-oxo-5-alpha-steroid 4-dehydrogenase C-terminal domain-containing protein n=1 Tax=Zalerion maritima TaxID=339359 RepID=A0AAD5S0N8_9PEZI|nr:uncharacterized protein MKZ38_007621 [Zalerion maritima]
MKPLIQDWFPPTKQDNYETILFLWTLFPMAASLQWLVSWYGMGKTSVESRLNLPGRPGWILMEVPGAVTLLYTMWMVSEEKGIEDLAWQNKVLAGLFVIHYSYRAIMYPLMAPSMSPIHIVVWLLGLFFQVMNGTCLGAWLGGYGPVTRQDWEAHPLGTLQFVVGIAVFYIGLAGNYIHDDELREIRRQELRRQERILAQQKREGEKGSVEKVYRLPQAGLFRSREEPRGRSPTGRPTNVVN